MDFLPLELYRPILSYLKNRTDLLALLYTNRSLSGEAERALYRNIAFAHSPSTAQSLERLILHLASGQRQPGYVISFRVWLPDDEESLAIPHTSQEYLREVIPRLVNLKELELPYSFGRFVVPPPRSTPNAQLHADSPATTILLSLSPFKLDTLHAEDLLDSG